MNNFVALLDLACGRAPDGSGHARRLQLIVAALLSSLAFAAIWGLAAGSTSAVLAATNVYKVPMVILLSALTALPAGLVALRLLNAPLRAHQLVNAFATSIFGGTLVLATLAPLVAIYYHTSSKAGLPLALGSVFVALATASLLFARNVGRIAVGVGRNRSRAAVAVLVAMFSAALLQFVAIASPIIGTHGTLLEGGIDALAR